jgi:hypothetical protein
MIRPIIGIAGALMLFPLTIVALLAHFVLFLKTHAEERQLEREANRPQVSEHYGPEIPECDKPLWERIKDRCQDDE